MRTESMDNILKNMTLQRRTIAAFAFMGAIVLVVALVGAIGNFRLSGRLESIANDAYPSTVALWKISEGQTQVQFSDRMLLNEAINPEQRRREIARINNAWNQINQGFIEQVQATTPRFALVNQGMEAQSAGAGQISEVMMYLSQTSSQTAEALRDINGAICQLNDASKGLHQENFTFKVNSKEA